MTFIEKIEAQIKDPQRRRGSNTEVAVDIRALDELIYHFRQLDNEARLAYEQAAQKTHAKPASKYTIEPHGPQGQYALYVGRDRDHHGLRLCNLNDFDMNEAETIKMIVEKLNQ